MWDPCCDLSPPSTCTVVTLLTGSPALADVGAPAKLMHLLRLRVLPTRRYSDLMDILNMVSLSRSRVITRLSLAYLRIPRLLYTTATLVNRLGACRVRKLTVAAMPRRPTLVLSNSPEMVRTIILPNEHNSCELDLHDGATDGLITRPCV